jgi:hypothetical protein
MPGFDRTQDQVISARMLETTLQSFVQVQGQIYQKQLELLAMEVEAKKKKPSVFFASDGYSITSTYPLPPDGNSALFWSEQGVTTVGVIPIQDADRIRINCVTVGSSADDLFFLYALSPWDGRSPIKADQFSLLNKMSSTPTSTPYPHDDIPCAGNKYMHVFGCLPAGQTDFISFMLNGSNTGFNLTYALVK